MIPSFRYPILDLNPAESRKISRNNSRRRRSGSVFLHLRLPSGRRTQLLPSLPTVLSSHHTCLPASTRAHLWYKRSETAFAVQSCAAMEAKTLPDASCIFRTFTACQGDPKTFIFDVRPHKQFQKSHVALSYNVRVSANGQALLVGSLAHPGCPAAGLEWAAGLSALPTPRYWQVTSMTLCRPKFAMLFRQGYGRNAARVPGPAKSVGCAAGLGAALDSAMKHRPEAVTRFGVSTCRTTRRTSTMCVSARTAGEARHGGELHGGALAVSCPGQFLPVCCAGHHTSLSPVRRWGKPVIVYGDEGLRKDNPVVKFLAQVGGRAARAWEAAAFFCCLLLHDGQTYAQHAFPAAGEELQEPAHIQAGVSAPESPCSLNCR